MMKQIFDPDLYHGWRKKNNFFEGWYFKLVNSTADYSISFIPGIHKNKDSRLSHSFIQVLDDYTKRFHYMKYPESEFYPEKNRFSMKINSSVFSSESIALNIKNKDMSISGRINFNNMLKWPDSVLNPGSMGFYNYLSFMECYSQVCAIDTKLSGKLSIDGDMIDFTGGKGYIEKNWGESFPHCWIWVQTNSFSAKEGALTCSIGYIPFPFHSFRGFLIGFSCEDKFYKFTTMNRSSISLNKNDTDIIITANHKNMELTIETKTNPEDFILCYGPKNNSMLPYVKETLSGKVFVELKDKTTNRVVFSDTGMCSGIEYGGEQGMYNIFALQ